jgi:hypothetical protein
MTPKHITLLSLLIALIAAGCVVVSEKPADSAPPPPATAAPATAAPTTTATTAPTATEPSGPTLRAPPRAPSDAGTAG